MTTIRPAIVLFLLLTIITGVVYPALVTLLAQVCFPNAANGSLVKRDGTVIGSELIGQSFASTGYLWSRPSATGPFPYNAAASSGSNLGPTNPALADLIKRRLAALRSNTHMDSSPPVDLVTASGSGLDPHISPAAAEFQALRVAKARGVSVAAVRALIAKYTQHRSFGVLGEPRVNVMLLNLALDNEFGEFVPIVGQKGGV